MAIEGTLDIPTRMEPTALLWAYQIRRENSHLQTQLESLKDLFRTNDQDEQRRRVQELADKVADLEQRISTADTITTENCRSLIDENTDRKVEPRLNRLDKSIQEDIKRLEARQNETNIGLEDYQNSHSMIRNHVSSFESSLTTIESVQAAHLKMIHNVTNELKLVKDAAAEDRDISAETRNLIAILAETELKRRSKAAQLISEPGTEELRLQHSDSTSLKYKSNFNDRASQEVSNQLFRTEARNEIHSVTASVLPLPQPLQSGPQGAIASASSAVAELNQILAQQIPVLVPTSRVVKQVIESRNIRSFSQATTQPETEIDLDDVGQVHAGLPFHANINTPICPPLQNDHQTASQMSCSRSMALALGSQLQPQQEQRQQTRRKQAGTRPRPPVEPTDRQTRSQAKATLAASAAAPAAAPAAASESPVKEPEVEAGSGDPLANEAPVTQSKKKKAAPRERATTRRKDSAKKSTKRKKVSKLNEGEEAGDAVEIIKKEQFELSQEKGRERKRKRADGPD